MKQGNSKFVGTYGKNLIKSELIAITIPAGYAQRKIQLPDNQNLRNSRLWHIETFNQIEVPKSILTSNAVVAGQLMQTIYLTLQGYQGKNFQWQKPLNDLHSIQVVSASGISNFEVFDQFPDNYTGQKVNWPKSYVEFTDLGLIDADNPQDILLDIYYTPFVTAKQIARAKSASFKNRK